MTERDPIVLGDHFERFVESQVAGGRFASAGEVVRAGLRLLEDAESHRQALRDALIAGEQSGPAEPFDIDAFLAEKKAQFQGGSTVIGA